MTQSLAELFSQPFFLIAGPCVIEDTEKGRGFTYHIAEQLKEVAERLQVPLIFKASYDKANRTSHTSFRGPGLEKGLAILAEIRQELEIPILTDVHCVEQVAPAAEVVDVLQIPAFLCRQTDLVQRTAEKVEVINIKKGQFLAPWDVEHVVAKVRAVSQALVLLTERGTSFGYNNLVVDMRSIPILKRFGDKVVFDATHSVQLPGGQGHATGGMPEMIPHLSCAAVAAGADGVFMEVHPEPSQALSDSANALALEQVEPLVRKLLRVHRAVNDKEEKD